MIFLRVALIALGAFALRGDCRAAATALESARSEGADPDATVSAEADRAIVHLSARVTWGQGGAVRFILRDWWRKDLPRSGSMMVEIANEGTEKFVLTGAESWGVVTRSNRRIALARPKRSRLVVRPFETETVDLVARKTIKEAPVALFFKSDRLEREVEVRAPYEEPKPDRVIPPIYDPDLVPRDSIVGIELTARIAADGRVEAIVAREGTKASPLLDAAAAAFRQWIFEPGLEGGTPQPSLHTERFRFGSLDVFRTVLPIGPSELMARLAQLLEPWYATVALPEAGGFVIVSRRHEDEGYRWARALLIRLGEEPGTLHTWVTVRALEMRQKTRRECDCIWLSLAAPGAREFLDVLRDKLGFDAQIQALVAPGFGIPSGRLEPLRAGAWEQEAVERLLRRSLSDDPSVRRHPPPEAIPSATDFLPREESAKAADDPATSGDTVPAKLVKKVKPEYPESARLRRIAGMVLLQAVVDEKGNVTRVVVLRSIPALDQAAIDAVCCWKYEAGPRDGRPSEARLTIGVEFTLK